ncbi:hypothetical protein TBLA_0A01300 [Henningerozyma blattae CBS 6284]|uniref:Uncharacterized protein n=1 Tax=Henningerozyma blattae (strain ATCC 34711 / CBS 6284 / DSM 70876 / NBRC 10599 / NRRL Y-10934 / UCD 77-7) TaxID=1071380 RepID=I2GUX7_HENB6|nr:hypothetical protein TBLA_0A01300 [Tetrapisispora blattae CBS 6284]CCH57929.1 hypothetical protein TBLA_0A01300 [Tetrapisispora blattae CBS 6284]
MKQPSAYYQYNNVTLKTLTAYQLMERREQMCELFQLADNSERHNLVASEENQKRTLAQLKDQLEKLKCEKNNA